MKKIAVVLSGCGHLDGAEIHESVLTLLAISQAGVEWQCLAPNRDQYHVLNHANQTPMKETRNIMVEAARIARGNIKALDQANIEDYDAVIFPGGFGAAKNLFDFALKGDASYQVQADVLAFAQKIIASGKPSGFICIAPMMIPHIYPKGVKMTIGNDAQTAQAAIANGAKHLDTALDGICLDEQHKVVTTPAYMLGQNIAEVNQGIQKLVKAVIAMI